MTAVQLMEQNPEFIFACSQVRGTAVWGHLEPSRSKGEVLRASEEEDSSPPSAAHWLQTLRPGWCPGHF